MWSDRAETHLLVPATHSTQPAAHPWAYTLKLSSWEQMTNRGKPPHWAQIVVDTGIHISRGYDTLTWKHSSKVQIFGKELTTFAMLIPVS